MKKRAVPPQPALIDHPAVRELLLEGLGPSGLVMVDTKGIVVYASRRAQRVLGIPSRVLVGSNAFKAVKFYNEQSEILSPERLPWWQALHRKGFKQIMPFFCFYQQGKKMIPVALQPIQIARGGKILGAMLQIREATRKLKVDEMKTLFVSFAAHQLKTPSSIVKGFLELMLRNGKKAYTAEQWDNLQSAYEANEHLINLSRTLLNLTRLEGGLIEPHLAPVNIQQIVQAKIASRRLLLDIKRIELEVLIGKARGFETDEVFISEILDILLNNAIKYSPENGKISILGQVNRLGLTMAVQDQGEGMTAEDKGKLFKQMAPDDSSHNSHGLGLLMAKKYLDLLGGSIEVQSARGSGSRFLFSIPQPLP
jgi:signal transduction histidine kinase